MDRKPLSGPSASLRQLEELEAKRHARRLRNLAGDFGAAIGRVDAAKTAGEDEVKLRLEAATPPPAPAVPAPPAVG